MTTTFPDDDTWVTDSAAATTALATGHKTYNGAIGIDRHEAPQTSLVEEARNRGMLIGVIATSQINHATLASFLAHNKHRKNYNTNADGYLGEDSQSAVAELLLGGAEPATLFDLILGSVDLSWLNFARSRRALIATQGVPPSGPKQIPCNK
ncbi:MAG: alkaline phosphatase, partial [Shewanella sp.]|nr:alkaline phosphatase [Shewanella sp.]MCF1429911.1 alkaline phosphatase [Shewanella sp.]